MSNLEDWDVDVTEESSEDESLKVEYEITNYPADTTLSGYLRQWDNKQLVVPPFQRGYVWDQTRASKLIESFLLGLPVPGVFLYKERNSSRFLIIDGQQRIRSVVYFLKGLFNEKKFRLRKISDKWSGKTFDELDEDSRFNLENSVMRSTIIQQISPDDNTSIYHIFERLNTGGINLNPMEIRQCISHGEFVKALKRMNDNEDWQKILGRSGPDKRMRDVELVLRIVALAENQSNYDKPMKGFLNNYMETKKSGRKFSELEKKFSGVCKYVYESIGEKPFHFKQKLNYGFLDSVFVSLFTLNRPKDLLAVLKKLKQDENYVSCITNNTSDTTVLQNRLKIASSYFQS